MTPPLIPPRGVFVPTRLLFNHEIPGVARDTLVQLMALAWWNPRHELPPLSFEQLKGLTGKSVSTLYSHFAFLQKDPAALRLRRAGDGLIIVTLADWLYPRPGENSGNSEYSRKPENSRNRENSGNSDSKNRNFPDSWNRDLNDPDHDQDQDLRSESGSDQNEEEEDSSSSYF